MKLHYPSKSPLVLEGFSDASYVSCPNTWRSCSGNIFRIGNSTITWKSQKQKSVATSTTVAEYMVLSLTARQIVWLKNALKELRIEVSCALRCDNTGSIDIAENPKINEWTKYIDVAYYYTRERLIDHEFSLLYIESTHNLADLLMKPLGKQLHQRFTKQIMCDSEMEY